MTTDTAQNTVFTVKAPIEVVVVPVRCDEGQRLIKEWVAKYNATVKETGDKWQDVLMRDFSPYLRHAKNCDQCMIYEYSLRGRGLEQEEK